MIKYFLLYGFLLIAISCKTLSENDTKILTGADQLNAYISLLENKNVGLLVNHTSRIGSTHLVDTLINMGVSIQTVFSPEHGFRGNQPDGEQIIYDQDTTMYQLVSLYGSSKKPSEDQIKDLDIMVIDIQDVGVRFYTYASTMTYVMEACAQSGVPVLILDRPNPHGSYIDGPVMEDQYKSFVGMHPIPLVHGCTFGELAVMINGEGWLKGQVKCDLEVVKIKNWDHLMPYSLPVKPSPNLPNDLAISLYPSLALFEGTVVSVGRGTDAPFQVVGHPEFEPKDFSFTPEPNQGSKYPPLEGKECFGMSFTDQDPDYRFTLSYLISFYKEVAPKLDQPFFNEYFEKLAGTDQLRKQIESGMTEEEIKATWQEDLKAYQEIRSRYLLYN